MRFTFFFSPAAKKISSRFDKISTLYTVFFFFFFGDHVRDAVTKWPLVPLGGILEQTGPISVAATVSNIMQASESHLKCKYLQRE